MLLKKGEPSLQGEGINTHTHQIEKAAKVKTAKIFTITAKLKTYVKVAMFFRTKTTI